MTSGGSCSLTTCLPMAEIANTSERPVSQARDEIIREAKRLEERTRDSAKGHQCAAEGWTGRHLWLGIPTVILSTIVGAATFSKYATDYPFVSILSGVLSITVAVLSGVTTFLNPNERQNNHLTAAHSYDTLNNQTRIFWTIECWQEGSEEILTSKLKELVGTKDALNKDSPQVPPWAWKMAKARMKAGESSFEVDKPQA